MFQYAYGRRLSLDNNISLALDVNYLENQPKGEVTRFLELEHFNIQAKIRRININENSGKDNHFLRGIFLPQLTIVEERKFTFDRDMLQVKNNSLLIGYWQSEKYFKKYEKEIRSDFTFNQTLLRTKAQLADDIMRTENTVALQVRRGDFVWHPVSSTLNGLLPMDYYQKAVKKLAKEIKNPVFYVVSDDHKWCEANIKTGYPTVFVKTIPKTGWQDMYLMSLCQNQIIANSTFGWWAAWLNSNPDKIVITPKKWFLDNTLDSSDLIPSSWQRV